MTGIKQQAAEYLALAEASTPGPWNVVAPKSPSPGQEGDRLIVNAETREHIAESFQHRMAGRCDVETAKHNANFIAASHEGAEIIRALLSMLEAHEARDRVHLAEIEALAKDAAAAIRYLNGWRGFSSWFGALSEDYRQRITIELAAAMSAPRAGGEG